MIINKPIILVTPAAALKRLLELMTEADFYYTAANSFLRIGGGFLFGAAVGWVLGLLSWRFEPAKSIISPLMAAVRSVPVASFVILALFWMSSRNLSVFISALIVAPLVYGAVNEGMTTADRNLLEMADVFGFGAMKKFRYIYFPALMPFLRTACITAAGLAFKSGAAAEVIGQPDHTLGDMLFRSKLYLETADLFAWTAVIIILGKLFERLVTGLLELIYNNTKKVRGGDCSDD